MSNSRLAAREPGDFVDHVLRGTKLATLPVEQQTELELVIKMKIAKALGVAIPPSPLASAEEVIE